jgi:hypothetical protein
LRLAEAVDGVGTFLEDLVRASTAPVVRDRIASAGEFLEYLALAETDARAQEPSTTVDPSIAKRDDNLDAGFVVIRKLGRGGTADALLVRRDGEDEELVLKVAVDEAHGDRLQAEAAVLRRLHHQNIVRVIDTLTVSGRAAILMEKAGDRTLAERLRGDDMPSLDLMRRSGKISFRPSITLKNRASPIATSNLTISASHPLAAAAACASCCSISL